MQKQFYFLSPIEVVRVTSQNLEEVAEWCGGRVAATESKKVKGRMDNYVWVPTPKGTHLTHAFPGMFVTKRVVVTLKGDLRETWAVFRREYFEKNYFDSPVEALDATWGRAELEKSGKKPKPPTKKEAEPQPATITINVDTSTATTPQEIAKAAIRSLQQAMDLPVDEPELYAKQIEQDRKDVRDDIGDTAVHEVNAITENGVEGPVTHRVNEFAALDRAVFTEMVDAVIIDGEIRRA